MISMVVSGSPKRWDRWHIIPQLASNTTYSPCLLGGYMLPIPPYSIIGEPETTIDIIEPIPSHLLAISTTIDDIPFLKLTVRPWKSLVGSDEFPYGAFGPIFRCYVSFRECTSSRRHDTWNLTWISNMEGLESTHYKKHPFNYTPILSIHIEYQPRSL